VWGKMLGKMLRILPPPFFKDFDAEKRNYKKGLFSKKNLGIYRYFDLNTYNLVLVFLILVSIKSGSYRWVNITVINQYSA
jgi:hypothetical protein